MKTLPPIVFVILWNFSERIRDDWRVVLGTFLWLAIVYAIAIDFDNQLLKAIRDRK